MRVNNFCKYLFASLIACFFILSKTVISHAAEYDLWVNGVRVNDTNKADILGDGTASFNSSQNKLTLKKAVITKGYKYMGDTYGICSNLSSLNIVGSAKISGCDVGIGMSGDGKLSINGTGNGINSSGSTDGIARDGAGDMTIKGKVSASGGFTGIFNGGGTGSVIINEGSVTAKGTNTSEYGYGIWAYKLIIKQGTVNAAGNGRYGIICQTELQIKSGITKVVAKAPNGTDAMGALKGVEIDKALLLNKPSGGSIAPSKQTIIDASGKQVREVVIASKNADKKKASMSLNTTSVTVQKGKTLKTVKATLKNDKISSVKSADPKVATVTYDGKTIAIKGIKKGTTKVTIKTKSGISKKITVKVQNTKVTTSKLSLSKTSVSLLKKGKKTTITVKAAPDYYSTKEKVTVKSSDKNVAKASIDTATGKITITAVKKGTCKITVKAGKKSAKISVTVKN